MTGRQEYDRQRTLDEYMIDADYMTGVAGTHTPV